MVGGNAGSVVLAGGSKAQDSVTDSPFGVKGGLHRLLGIGTAMCR